MHINLFVNLSLQGMKSLCIDFEKRHQTLVFTNVTPGVNRGLTALHKQVRIAANDDQLQNILKCRYHQFSNKNHFCKYEWIDDLLLLEFTFFL